MGDALGEKGGDAPLPDTAVLAGDTDSHRDATAPFSWRDYRPARPVRGLLQPDKAAGTLQVSASGDPDAPSGRVPGRDDGRAAACPCAGCVDCADRPERDYRTHGAPAHVPNSNVQQDRAPRRP